MNSKIVIMSIAAAAIFATAIILLFNAKSPALPAGNTGNTTTVLGSEGNSSSVIASPHKQFALAFYSKIASDPSEDGKNIFFSPWSISSAFAVANEGAREATAKQIQLVFGFPEDQNLQRASYKDALQNLADNNGSYTLSTANALWIRDGYELSQ